MLASVVIATRDRAAFLRDSLTSLRAQSAVEQFEIVVVDNGSSDETADVVAQFAPLARRIYVAEPNRGKARNAGIAAAQAPLIVFCDDDTLAPREFVAAHLAAHAGAADRVVTGPIVNVPDAAHLSAVTAAHYSRAYFCTCNASAPRSALDAVKGFDEAFDLYGWEDTDLGVRLRAAGMQHVFAWDAYIYHVKPPAVMTLQRRVALAREKGEMAARFVRKSPTWPVKLATGAYGANFARAALANAAPLRRLYERIAGPDGRERRGVSALAADALVDAAYIDALRAALRPAHG
ncbi:MAG: glycosyltransferase [Candidatus Eremiobacteraeota bacterium]|nr:glycosyltransferase [Candidatus Eremiobacteraeota bacterium]MBV8366778.1 glycosyltransferase [Candidatus Eremiobacteraeota bacterium]